MSILAAPAVIYPVETFTEAERAALEPHFTNLDRPVFALVNLPETVKGALFARYSRYRGTLRRLYLDEFAADAEAGAARAFDGEEGERARQLYERIFLGYGDDSVAQLGGAHVACEWVSNVMTKVLQRGRLAAYLEQSTRYIPYDGEMPGGGYRYWRDDSLGPEYAQAMDFLFDTYSEALPRVQAWAAERFPRADGEPEAAHARSIRAKALDLLRGLLPAASLSHMGIFATGQAYEQLLLRLFASPLPEAQRLRPHDPHRAQGHDAELRGARGPPGPRRRVDHLPGGARRDRGGRWAGAAGARPASRREGDRPVRAAALGARAPRTTCWPRCCSRRLPCSEEEARARGARAAARRARADAVRAGGRAAQPPPPPGPRVRGAALPVRGGVRLRRLPRPPAPPHAHHPVADAVAGPRRGRARTSSTRPGWATSTARRSSAPRAEYARLRDGGRPELAPYALCLGYRIRYVLDMNAREAMHLVELRSGREGHPGYRAVAHEIHAQIAAVHPAVAAAMTYVDSDTEPRLERILSEIRTQARRAPVA